MMKQMMTQMEMISERIQAFEMTQMEMISKRMQAFEMTQMEMISECRQVLEHIKEVKAPKDGLDDSKTESDADGDSDESD